jgi:leader peptidase (prepilin peptidase)/N-methyltransferase
VSDLLNAIFDPKNWAMVPFHFWTVCVFLFGAIVGSFLNVCIHRMPRGESVIRPSSHCPGCGYSIPWYLNIPLFTWLWLRGRCAHCGEKISPRYFLVELLTGLMFAACWVRFGHQSALVPFVFCALIGGLIAATFIDFEHFIIPDEITLGGTVVGLLLAFFVPGSHISFPFLQPMTSASAAMKDSFLGVLVGGGVVYGVLRLGKLLFGRQKVQLTPRSRIVFTETALILPEQEILYEELFYRPGDTIRFEAERVEMIDRCYGKAKVSLQPKKLQIDGDTFDPDTVHHLEAEAEMVVLPREAMGLGDVKFMAAIGAFLGWRAVLFSLAASSLIGTLVVGMLIAMRRREWSARLPYGPYIALAAVIWLFGGYLLLRGVF